jgi:PTH1 family peptidyl-tRNA hydrolase
MGVGGKPHPDYDMADWVLGHFSPEDAKVMDEAAKRAADAVEMVIRDGFDKAQNQYSK